MKFIEICIFFLICYLHLDCSKLSDYSKEDCKAEYDHMEKQYTDRIITLSLSSQNKSEIDLTLLQLWDMNRKRSSCFKGKL